MFTFFLEKETDILCSGSSWCQRRSSLIEIPFLFLTFVEIVKLVCNMLFCSFVCKSAREGPLKHWNVFWSCFLFARPSTRTAVVVLVIAPSVSFLLQVVEYVILYKWKPLPSSVGIQSINEQCKLSPRTPSVMCKVLWTHYFKKWIRKLFASDSAGSKFLYQTKGS